MDVKNSIIITSNCYMPVKYHCKQENMATLFFFIGDWDDEMVKEAFTHRTLLIVSEIMCV